MLSEIECRRSDAISCFDRLANDIEEHYRGVISKVTNRCIEHSLNKIRVHIEPKIDLSIISEGIKFLL